MGCVCDVCAYSVYREEVCVCVFVILMCAAREPRSVFAFAALLHLDYTQAGGIEERCAHFTNKRA